MKSRTRVGALIVLWAFLSLACAQAGEILSPEEATRRAQPTAVPTIERGAAAAGQPDVGDVVLLVGRSFLVNLLDVPAGRIIAGQNRGSEVVIMELAEVDGELWYRIDGDTGEGWVTDNNIEVIEEEVVATPTPRGLPEGSTAYLVGRSFLVNLLQEPSPTGRIIAGQERGAAVTIVQVADIDGKLWYLVSAPTGEGWIAEDNLATEAP